MKASLPQASLPLREPLQPPLRNYRWPEPDGTSEPQPLAELPLVMVTSTTAVGGTTAGGTSAAELPLLEEQPLAAVEPQPLNYRCRNHQLWNYRCEPQELPLQPQPAARWNRTYYNRNPHSFFSVK